MMGRKFLGIQTVISGKTRFFRTVYGAILGFMRLERLSVLVTIDESGHFELIAPWTPPGGRVVDTIVAALETPK